MRSLRAAGLIDVNSDAPQMATTHMAHASLTGWHAPPFQVAAPPVQAGQSDKRQRPRKSSAKMAAKMAWAFLALGLMTFVCGAVLIGLSLLQNRPELWTIGVPIALGGHVVLLIGLALQFDRLWLENRQTASSLDDVHDVLHDVPRAPQVWNVADRPGQRPSPSNPAIVFSDAHQHREQ